MDAQENSFIEQPEILAIFGGNAFVFSLRERKAQSAEQD